MSDRELLELAAKAIGTEIQVAIPSGKYFRIDTGHYWNPLTDDGDALRLAVKLRLIIDICPWGTDSGHWSNGLSENSKNSAIRNELYSGPEEAARRAIVRAAAEIGRQ